MAKKSFSDRLSSLGNQAVEQIQKVLDEKTEVVFIDTSEEDYEETEEYENSIDIYAITKHGINLGLAKVLKVYKENGNGQIMVDVETEEYGVEETIPLSAIGYDDCMSIADALPD